MAEEPERIHKHTRSGGVEYTLPCNHSLLVLGFRVGAAVALLVGAAVAVLVPTSPLSGPTILLALPLTWLADRSLIPAVEAAKRGSVSTLAAMLLLALIPAGLGALQGALAGGMAAGALAATAWLVLGILPPALTLLRIERHGFVLRSAHQEEVRIAFRQLSSIERIAFTRRWQDISIGRINSNASARLGLDLSEAEAAWMVELLRQHLARWEAERRACSDTDAGPAPLP